MHSVQALCKAGLPPYPKQDVRCTVMCVLLEIVFVVRFFIPEAQEIARKRPGLSFLWVGYICEQERVVGFNI